MILQAGTNPTIDIQIVDDSGLPVTGLNATTFPTISYVIAGAHASINVTLSDLALITTAYTSGGVKERSGGYYRLDLPADAIATAATQVRVIGEASGKRVICPAIDVADIAATATNVTAAQAAIIAALPAAAPSTAEIVTAIDTSSAKLAAAATAANVTAAQTAIIAALPGAAPSTAAIVTAIDTSSTKLAAAATAANVTAAQTAIIAALPEAAPSTAEMVTAIDTSSAKLAAAATAANVTAAQTAIIAALPAAAPSTAAITTAVWHGLTASSDFTLTGSIGKLLVTSGSGGSSGGQVTGFSSDAITQLASALNGVVVAIRGPVSSDNLGYPTVTITAGDDYSTDDSRSIQIDLDGTTLPDLSTWSVELRLQSGRSAVTVAGSITVPTGTTRTVQFSPNHSETIQLPATVDGRFTVVLTSDDDDPRIVTPLEARGVLTVLAQIVLT